jgi:hypothetical protein
MTVAAARVISETTSRPLSLVGEVSFSQPSPPQPSPGCWNDPHHRFDHKDFLWCPRHKDTPRQFECTRLITVEQVKAMIQRVLLTSNAGYPR